MEIITNSEKETEKFAENFAKNLKGNETLALFGGLGSGKTAFTRGMAGFFGGQNQVCSPTFAIMNEYNLSGGKKIYHFDMYRIESYENLESTGFFELLGNGITVIEWSENIEFFLPGNALKIKFEKLGENTRRIKIENFSS